MLFLFIICICDGESSVKRNYLGVFVFYDKKGIVDEYVKLLLQKFAEAIEDIVVVVNGWVTSESQEVLQQYATNVYIRDNSGYDAGAYKDFFLKYVSVKDLLHYDALLLMNDTFYGPLYPLDNLLKFIDTSEDMFGGITMQPYNALERIDEHIQSYFMFVKKDLLRLECFCKFWQQLSKPETHQEAVENFEIAFSTWIRNAGYTYSAFDGSVMNKPCWNDGENPYLCHILNLVKDKEVMFLKKGCFSMSNPGYKQTMETLTYIEKKMNYDIGYIWDNIYRLSKEGNFNNAINYYKLEEFYNKFSNIYIYGYGRIGHSLKSYFAYRGWEFRCFIISDNQELKDAKDVKKLSMVSFQSDDGVIIAVGKKLYKEIRREIGAVLDKKQILFPEYDTDEIG